MIHLTIRHIVWFRLSTPFFSKKNVGLLCSVRDLVQILFGDVLFFFYFVQFAQSCHFHFLSNLIFDYFYKES